MRTIQSAMLAAIPEAADRLPLARRIDSMAEVVAMTDDQLHQMHADHSREIVVLTGLIQAAEPCKWRQSAQQALRVLRLHHQWIVAELRQRDRAKTFRMQRDTAAAAAAARAEARLSVVAAQADLQQARLQRINAANAATAQQIGVFKEVAREVLGMEMYAHLWELTRQRIAENIRETS